MISQEIGEQKCPELSPEIIRHINDLCFSGDIFETGFVDAVLIFGTPYPINQQQIATAFTSVFSLHKPKVVYVTGGQKYAGPIESEEILRFINPRLYKGVDFRLDCTSTNTKENVEQAVVLGLAQHRKVIFIAKSPHCGRCKLTLAKYAPNLYVRSRSYDPILSDDMPPIRRDNWYAFPEVSKKMWKEVLKIEEYGKCGDIHYPPDIDEHIQSIHRLVSARH